MKNNITLSESELPQLRQMVLENSRRISKNETKINEMKISEQEQKGREREAWWENARAKKLLRRKDVPRCRVRTLQQREGCEA